MAKRKLYSFILSVVIPYFGIFSGIYFFRYSEKMVFGFPILYFWLFMWFFLTTICLSLAWFLFDRDDKTVAAKEK